MIEQEQRQRGFYDTKNWRPGHPNPLDYPDLAEQNAGFANPENWERFFNPEYHYNPRTKAPPRLQPMDDIDDMIDLTWINETKKQITDLLVDNIKMAESADTANTRTNVRKIHPSFHTYYNSVSISTGYQGAGKTFKALEEALGVVVYTPNTKHLIFIKRKRYDPTFESVKGLFQFYGCDVREVEYENAEGVVQEFLRAKNIYNIVRRFIQTRKDGNELPHDRETMGLTDADVEDALDVLGLRNFRDFARLNTIIIFDDVGNSGLFKNPDSYFNNRLKLCRDDNVIYYLTIHGITQLSPSIKANTAVVYVFKGLSKERLGVIYRQLNLALDFGAFKGAYWMLGQTARARCLVVDNIVGDEPTVE
jgi:hypothetical protein